MFEKGYLIGGRYKIISTLGEGGNAQVFLAEDVILQKRVAVKALRSDQEKDPQTVQRFHREALATSELSHPHIVSILDVGSDHNRPYLVMEYVNGPDLEDYLQKNKPLSPKRVIALMDQILSAMALAHQHNVVHRDLKPQNILLDKKGNIKIVDFGIALALNQSALTQTNTAMGSVHYMSPEQARGSIATKQSDIYSLGIILYELLMGEVPFPGDNVVAVALKHFQEIVPSLHKQNPAIPQALENVVLKATAKDPRDRYDSIQEMKSDLDTSLHPARFNEPVFVPKHNPTQDATIVLPKITNTLALQSQEIPVPQEAENLKKSQTLWDNMKKHRWWWLGAGLAAFLIMLLLIFALSRKDEVRVPAVANLTEDQGRQALIKSGLKVDQVTKEYSKAVKKARIIRTSPGNGSLVKNGSSVTLILSKGQKLTEMPDVTGESYRSARRELEDLGFSVNKSGMYSKTIPKNQVLHQSKAAGSKVNPEKTLVTLTVSLGINPKEANIKLRDLTGYTLKGAQDYAHDNGLQLHVTQQASNNASAGTVIKQDPAAGVTVARGSTLNLVIADDSSEDQQGNNNQSSSANLTTRNFTVRPDPNAGGQGSHIQIYIADASHSLGNVYRDQYIRSPQTYTIVFDVSEGPAHIRIVRNGIIVLDQDINN